MTYDQAISRKLFKGKAQSLSKDSLATKMGKPNTIKIGLGEKPEKPK